MVSIYERYSTIPYAVYMRYYAVHTSYATYSVSSMEMSRIMDRIMDRIAYQSLRRFLALEIDSIFTGDWQTILEP